MLLWVWYRPVATAPMGPLVWEPPYGEGVAPKKTKDKKKNKRINSRTIRIYCIALGIIFNTL